LTRSSSYSSRFLLFLCSPPPCHQGFLVSSLAPFSFLAGHLMLPLPFDGQISRAPGSHFVSAARSQPHSLCRNHSSRPPSSFFFLLPLLTFYPQSFHGGAPGGFPSSPYIVILPTPDGIATPDPAMLMPFPEMRQRLAPNTPGVNVLLSFSDLRPSLTSFALPPGAVDSDPLPGRCKRCVS